MSTRVPTEIEARFRLDLLDLLHRHAAHVTKDVMLAITSYTVGQVIALQDRRVMTGAQAMQIVQDNIELGNAHAILAMQNPEGQA